MSTLIIEVYEAFLAAGIPEDKARAAARAMADDQNATKADIAKLDKELAIVKWMVGVVIVGMLALLAKAYFPHV
jgi:hypothetical protein